MHTNSFDPRAWNLVTSVALLAGCSARPLDPGAGETSTDPTSDGPESDDDADTTNPGECRSDDDCDTYYFCHDGECVECITTGDCSYIDGLECVDNKCVPDPDLPSGAMCYYDSDCPDFPDFQICIWDTFFGHGYCTPQGAPPPDCDPGPLGIPTILHPAGPVLALSFVDVDADGQGELVVATEAALLVYDGGVDAPTVTPREQPGLSVQGLAAGHFDAQPGEDVVLLAGGELHRYSADGISGFASATIEAGPMQNPYGLVAGDFDETAFTELLVFGAQGAVLQLEDGDVSIIDSEVLAAAAFDQSAPNPGLLLTGNDETLRLFDLMGGLVGVEPYDANFPFTSAVAAVHAPGLHRYVSTEDKVSWTVLRLWDPASFNASGMLFHPSGGIELAAGDFDGDQRGDLATVAAENTLVFSVADPRSACIASVELGVPGVETHHAVGDHDGDGDDELALALDSGVVVLIDGE